MSAAAGDHDSEYGEQLVLLCILGVDTKVLCVGTVLRRGGWVGGKGDGCGLGGLNSHEQQAVLTRWECYGSRYKY